MVGVAEKNGQPVLPPTVGGTAETLFPLKAGLLFFSPGPHRFFPGTQVDVVWFPEGAGGDEFTERIFRGPLQHMQLRAGRAVPRRYRNRRIGEFLKELELTEGRATGIPRKRRTEGFPAFQTK